MQGKNCAMSGVKCAQYYSCQFPAFVADLQARFAEPWRAHGKGATPDGGNGGNGSGIGGGGGGFSFLFVQLPSYVEDLSSMTYGGRNDSSLPLLRLAQAAALALPRVGMASLIDHGFIEGHYGSIHSMDKMPVANRLVLSARAVAYNDGSGDHRVISSGPTVQLVKLLANQSLRVEFKPETLSSEGLLLRTEGPVRQACAVGRNQTHAMHVLPMTPVPASQCGALSGFELRVGGGGEWLPLGMPQLSADRRSVVLLAPAAMVTAGRPLPLLHRFGGGVSMQLRYLWADWPVPTVYDARSFDGENGELPVPPFIANVTQ